MSEIIYAYIACKFADEGAVSIVDSFGNADNQVGGGLKFFFYFFDKCIGVKCNFRKIDEYRIIPFEFAGKYACSGEPACVAPHDFNNCNRLFIIVYRGIDGDFTYGGSYVFRRASEARSVICLDKVVVDRFRHTDDADLISYRSRVAGKFADGVHGIIAPDIEEIAYFKFFKFLK